jgi:ATP-dependent Clp protease ATP-binding subunit ClpX
MRHYQKYWKFMDREMLLAPSKVLLIGPSGTGKTHLIESLHSVVDFPLLRIDATKLNPTGASGGIKEEGLRKMIVQEAQRLVDTKKGIYHSLEGTVDQMVVFVDEIDKLGTSFESSGNWNSHTQTNFLTLFDNKAEYAGVSFVFAGAFTNITKKDANKRTGIGFGKHEAEKPEDMENRIVQSGLLPELVGRINSIVELDKFTEEDFYKILITRILPRKQMDLAAFGIFEAELDESDLYELAEKAYKSEQGIRYLQRGVDKLFLDLEFNYENGYKFLGDY